MVSFNAVVAFLISVLKRIKQIIKRNFFNRFLAADI